MTRYQPRIPTDSALGVCQGSDNAVEVTDLLTAIVGLCEVLANRKRS